MSKGETARSRDKNEDRNTKLKLLELLKSVEEFGAVKYSAYRTALKIRKLQTLFGFDHVRFTHIVGILDLHGLKPGNGDIPVEYENIQGLIKDVLYSRKLGNVSDEKDSCNEKLQLIKGFLALVYNHNQKSSIKSMCVQIFLTVLSRGRPIDKYRYLFRLFADHNNCISRKNCAVLLRELIRIPESLFERLSFGSHLIVPSIEALYRKCPGSLGIPETQFIKWMLEEPQSLVWWFTAHRLQCCEHVQHQVKCSCCKKSPIFGFRYQCLMCFGYDLCQQCFFTGQVSKNHKMHHPLEEYCQPISSRDITRTYIKILKNRLSWRSKGRDSKPGFLPIDSPPELVKELSDVLSGLCPQNLTEDDDGDTTLLSRTVIGDDIKATEPLHACAEELNSVIGHMEEENKIFHNEVGMLKKSLNVESEDGAASIMNREQVLMKCSNQLQAQIQRLKSLLQSHGIYNQDAAVNMGQNCTPEAPCRTVGSLPRLHSTPAIHSTRKAVNFHLSPICINNKENDSQALNHVDSANKGSQQLESITEVSFSDLTSMLPSDYELSVKSKAQGSCLDGQAISLDINEHLEKLLCHLESAFPKEINSNPEAASD